MVEGAREVRICMQGGHEVTLSGAGGSRGENMYAR